MTSKETNIKGRELPKRQEVSKKTIDNPESNNRKSPSFDWVKSQKLAKSPSPSRASKRVNEKNKKK